MTETVNGNTIRAEEISYDFSLNPDSWRLRSVGYTHIPDTTTKMLCDCVRKALEI